MRQNAARPLPQSATRLDATTRLLTKGPPYTARRPNTGPRIGLARTDASIDLASKLRPASAERPRQVAP